jgi:hypothetical protein
MHLGLGGVQSKSFENNVNDFWSTVKDNCSCCWLVCFKVCLARLCNYYFVKFKKQ